MGLGVSLLTVLARLNLRDLLCLIVRHSEHKKIEDVDLLLVVFCRSRMLPSRTVGGVVLWLLMTRTLEPTLSNGNSQVSNS
jgi:hypothetical protein